MRGKRRQIAAVVPLTSGERLSRSRPQDVGAVAPSWLLERLEQLEEASSDEIKEALLTLTTTQRRDPRLLPLYEQMIMNSALIGDDIQGLARALLCRLGLRETYTSLIVESQPGRCYHLRQAEHDTKTLCGVPIGDKWRRHAGRGSYSAYLNRTKKPRSCQKCYGKSPLPEAKEGLHFSVLSEEQALAIRHKCRRALSSPAHALAEAWAEWSEEVNNTVKQREQHREIAGKAILKSLYHLAAEELLTLSDANLLLLFRIELVGADETIEVIQKHYPILPRPSLKQMTEMIADEGQDWARRCQPYAGPMWFNRAVADQAFGRLIVDYWPEAIEQVRKKWTGCWEPRWTKAIIGKPMPS